MCCTKLSCLLLVEVQKSAEDDLVVLLGVAFLVDEEQALFLAERRIGEDHRVLALPRRGEAVVPGVDDHLSPPMPCRYTFIAHMRPTFGDSSMPSTSCSCSARLITIELLLESIEDVLIGVAQEPAGPRRRIADAVPGVGCITSHIVWMTGRGVKY